MLETTSSNRGLGEKGDVIHQRQQQIDPAGMQPDDPTEATKPSQKQPGQTLRDPQKGNDDAE